MVVHIDILTITRFHGSIDSRQKVLSSGIFKHFLQLTGKPDLHLLLAVITLNIGSNRIKCSLVLYYTLFVHNKLTFNPIKLPNILQRYVFPLFFFAYSLTAPPIPAVSAVCPSSLRKLSSAQTSDLQSGSMSVIAGHKYYIEMYWIDALSG